MSVPVKCLPTGIGEFMNCDVKLLQQLGWQGLIELHCPWGNFALLQNVLHPVRCLLHLYKHHGPPIKFSMLPWAHHQV